MSRQDKKREVAYAEVSVVPAVLVKWKCPACKIEASAFADKVAAVVHSGQKVGAQCNNCHKKYEIMKSVIEKKGVIHGVKG